MREIMHERLETEMTRKQFLQFLTVALLAVFGLNNLISLLTGNKFKLPTASNSDASNGFGSRRFGV